MNDTFETRSARIALSENKKTDTTDTSVPPVTTINVTKIKVNISIVSTLPMLTLTDELVTNSSIASVVTPVDLAALDAKNTLKDVEYFEEHGKERFTYITTTHSQITNNRVRMYHDAKYEDIIIIPELSYIDSDLNHTVYDIRGYRVGGGVEVDDIYNDLIVPGEEYFKLPLTKSNIENTCEHVRLHGVARDSDHTYYYKSLPSGDTIVNKKLTTVGMVKLGSADELFVEPGATIPMYTIMQATLDRYALKFLGNKKPTSIYIPLNF